MSRFLTVFYNVLLVYDVNIKVVSFIRLNSFCTSSASPAMMPSARHGITVTGTTTIPTITPTSVSATSALNIPSSPYLHPGAAPGLPPTPTTPTTPTKGISGIGGGGGQPLPPPPSHLPPSSSSPSTLPTLPAPQVERIF